MDVALVTCSQLPEPDRDEAIVLEAFRAAKVDARMLAWDDPDAPFSDAPLTVLRSPWNYAWRPDAFRAWLRSTAEVTRLFNPLPVLEWNLHKRYLLDLNARGIPTVPTELLRRGSAIPLRELLDGRRWARAIIKPAVSAGSRLTLAVDETNMDAGEAHLRKVVADEDVLVQPYQRAVEGYGERALVWVDGELTHAIRKSRRLIGDHESVTDATIRPEERELALRAIAAVGAELLYARVDMVPADDGSPVLMELELLEPSLFLDSSPVAVARFVDGVRKRLLQ